MNHPERRCPVCRQWYCPICDGLCPCATMGLPYDVAERMREAAKTRPVSARDLGRPEPRVFPQAQQREA